MEHLVESYMGNYYISNLPPELIERELEGFYDRDTILTSWRQGDEIDRYYSLLEFFSEGQLRTKEDIKAALDVLDYQADTLLDKFSILVDDIAERHETTLDILYDLVEGNYISRLEYDTLCHMAYNNSSTELSLLRFNLKEFITSPIDIARVKSMIRDEKKFYKGV